MFAVTNHITDDRFNHCFIPVVYYTSMKPLIAFLLGVAVTLAGVLIYFQIPKPSPATLSGSVSYPSDAIPDGLVICAENIKTGKTTCTGPFISSSQGGTGFLSDDKFTHGVGYELPVPAGVYNVYATAPGLESKAYYSYFVACVSADEQRGQVCDDHTPIDIEVVPGQSTTGIDPGDWYN